MNVEQITASDFLEAQDSASRNGADKPAFRNLLKELKQLPECQERLVFDFLSMTLRALERGVSPRGIIVEALYFEGSIGNSRVPEYLTQLEKVIFRSFELLGQEKTGAAEYTAFRLTLSLTLMALRKRDQARFRIVLNTLREAIVDTDRDPRYEILSKVASRSNEGGLNGS